MSNTNITQISKYLSLILRHQPQSIGLVLDPNGWADVDELLNKSKLKFSFQQLVEVVEKNDKQRFILSDDQTKIRANQGHSIKIDLDLTPQIPPPILYHGTVEKYLDSIRTEGLKKMNRNHVHLSKDIETAQKVGNRRGIAIILKIDAEAMNNDKILFYCSENGVWLTDNVPTKYISF
ncbi:RNA 2'-phosphotransferase [Emticicia sp. W12TSBA100-4]|uniref:RNA 2'-phosphotransferase n=1 Tax=Emticicia sp. W12TSBA100-4 TaxID=3160965 RepID=UPI0033066653